MFDYTALKLDTAENHEAIMFTLLVLNVSTKLLKKKLFLSAGLRSEAKKIAKNIFLALNLQSDSNKIKKK